MEEFGEHPSMQSLGQGWLRVAHGPRPYLEVEDPEFVPITVYETLEAVISPDTLEKRVSKQRKKGSPLSQFAVKKLELEFMKNNYPKSWEYAELAVNLNLPKPVVQRWFQRQRFCKGSYRRKIKRREEVMMDIALMNSATSAGCVSTSSAVSPISSVFVPQSTAYSPPLSNPELSVDVYCQYCCPVCSPASPTGLNWEYTTPLFPLASAPACLSSPQSPSQGKPPPSPPCMVMSLPPPSRRPMAPLQPLDLSTKPVVSASLYQQNYNIKREA